MSADRTSPDPAVAAPPDATGGGQRRLLFSLALCSLAGLACWTQWRVQRSAQSRYDARRVAVQRMLIDAQRIGAMRRAPRRAAERERPKEELLAQIETSLTGAGIPIQLWQDSIPQTPQRLAESPYQRFSTRLYFESISLDQLVRFTHRLLAGDPSLAISSLHLAAPPGGDETRWNADLAVGYLVYAPAEKS